MKLTMLFTLIAASTLALGAPAAPAKDLSQDPKPEWAELFGGASLPVVWQSLTASADLISKAVAAGRAEGVPDWAETLHLASHALADQIRLPDAERMKRLKAALGQAAKLADEVLDAANHNQTEKLADSFRRLQSALALARSRLPKEVTEAAPATPRFAKAPKQRDDHKH